MALESIQIPGYELLRTLGSGGMSVVYLALQRSLDRNVAIKIMKRVGLASSEEAKQFERRFLLEGRTMAALPHRNIVAVYDIVTEDEIAYIVMEYLDGGTLSDRMRGGMSLGQVLSVIVQTATALEYAHSRGIVHRDLKSSNIMFRDGVVPVLTDFGIARQQDSAATALTQAGMMVGTPQYMSPEQINGQIVDGRADQYSLGVLFYELLTGTQPFTGDTALAVLMAHLTKEAAPLPAEFAGFQDIVGRMMAKDREQRYPNLAEFITELKARLTQNDALLQRLQLNTTQSLSDQLHDLGFDANTPSGVNTGGSMPRITLPSATTPAGRSQVSRSTRKLPPPPRQPVPLWKWIAGAAAVLIVVAGIWFAAGRKHALSDDVQEWVTIRLERAGERIEQGQLVGENSAYSDLQDVLQKDAENKRAAELLDRIAANLGAAAQTSFNENNLDKALELSNESLLVRSDNAAAQALKAKIVDTQRSAKQKQQIADLVQAAESAGKAGRIFGDKSAYALLTRARSLAPGDSDIAARISTLVKGELDKAQRSLDAGEFTVATNTLTGLEPYLETEPAFVAMKAKLLAAMQKQQSDTEIAAVVTRANAQIRAGKLAGPAGDNASESLADLRKLAANDARTNEIAHALGLAFFAEARRLDAANQGSQAISTVDLALQADPQTAGAQDFKAQIEKRLGQREADIARALSLVSGALNEQRFVPPAANDAYTGLQNLLKLDPENRQGKELLTELPKRIAASAQARAAKDAGGASDLIAAALKVYPQEATLTSLQSQLSAQVAREATEKSARAQRDRIAALLAGTAPDRDKLNAAAGELAALAAAKDTSEETIKLRQRLLALIDSRVRSVDSTAEFDAVAAILSESKPALAAETGYATLVAALPGLRAKIATAEQARADAERGELVLNAYPWGKVESVLDANSKPVALPAETVTPLTLTLPAGSYIVTVRHPNAKPTKVIARVEAGKRNTASASFPTLNAKDYFNRAGW
jgi:serine/threonine-protein kinase PpkA